jgi:VIT1/CCC1 family predicted Fe2+/Mn2+ transporter
MENPRTRIANAVRAALPWIRGVDGSLATALVEMLDEYEAMRKQLLRLEALVHEETK